MYKPYKILMTTMSMGYGGAETHILELARYLKYNGVEVKIISNGGEYVKEVEAAGIEHITAPFHTRKLSDMRRSGKILKRTIKNFKPDVVHAHARIPAFVAAGICKRAQIPLVTTAHGTYSTSPLLNFATNWGDYILYVSDDIKEYLIKNYKVKTGSMARTINAINTDLFSGTNIDLARRELEREFGTKPEEKIILTVARLDKCTSYHGTLFNPSFTAYKLIENAQKLYLAHKNTRIIIVGAGEVFEDVKRGADEVNRELGFEYIILAGGRTDVYRFCAVCDIFIGISRAALEALSCGKNVILCGDTGYLGRFCAENKISAEKTNFTCRGFSCTGDVDNMLLGDIDYCLNDANNAELAASQNLGARLVAQEYGVKRMADDAYLAYEKAMLKYKDCDFILTGYYGHDNAGDTALMFTIINNIAEKNKNYKICVLAKNPKKLQRYIDDCFTNIVTKSRFNIFHMKKAIRSSKALVFGGGTLLQDNTSTRSLSYYLWLLKTAQKYNKKTILYANGIGPLYLEKNIEKVKNVMQNITLATIRDEPSYNLLLDMGVDSGKIYSTADEVITIGQNKHWDAYKRDFREYIKGDYVVISVRKWKGATAAFLAEFTAAIDIICRETKLIPVYVIMEPKNDRALSEHMATLHSKGYVIKSDGCDIEKILTVIRSSTAVISMRLHTLIFAAVFGVPMIGISYDPKVQSFLGQIYENEDYAVDIRGFEKEILIEKFRTLISYRGEVKNTVEAAAEKLYESAKNNVELFIQEIDK